MKSALCKLVFEDVIKTPLTPHARDRGAAAANGAAAARCIRPSSDGPSYRWRPKRTSDRFLQRKDASEPPRSPQRKRSNISVSSQDSLAVLRAQRHAGSSQRRVSFKVTSAESQSFRESPEQKSSEEDSDSPSTPKKNSQNASGGDRPDDLNRYDRRRWSGRRDVGTNRGRVSAPPQKNQQKLMETIVLSSEEEDQGGGGVESHQDTSEDQQAPPVCLPVQAPPVQAPPVQAPPVQAPPVCSLRGQTPPPFLQLGFSSLHAGLTDLQANGDLRITEHDITLPLTGAEEAEVTVVASQVRGYGLWDGGVVRDGPLLAALSGSTPALLFLWVTDAQAKVLQRELSFIHTCNTSGPPCSFLLLVLKEQLQELQAALLASMLDLEEYRRCRSSLSPLEWTDGLLLLQSCPPPLNQHLLGLLGVTADGSSPAGTRRSGPSGLIQSSPAGTRRSGPSGLIQSSPQVSSRLIQYPAPPCKGRISVSKEDLACLGGGEFLNDVIIDFYLKYLLLEGVRGPVAERSHIFSSFFFKQLSRRRVAGEDSAPCVPDRHTRHQRVRRWTRHLDIFTKDFLFVPVNQEAHWFLVVVCFPGLEDIQYEDFQRPTGGLKEQEEEEEEEQEEEQQEQQEEEQQERGSLSSHHPPSCTEQGLQRDSVLKRPCILVMDSLKLTYQKNVCQLLRDYLQVEWVVRRGTRRVFTSASMRCCNCRVPLQDNSSDCGLYLLQYVESFLQNPVVHFDLPLRLDTWFPRQKVRQKREEIRSLILKMHQNQSNRK